MSVENIAYVQFIMSFMSNESNQCLLWGKLKLIMSKFHDNSVQLLPYTNQITFSLVESSSFFGKEGYGVL